MTNVIMDRLKFTLKRARSLFPQGHFIPSSLILETTVSCNASCVYCPRHKTNNLPKPPHMNLELAKHIIDISPFANHVAPYSRGEPFLYPHIIEIVRYLTDHNRTSLLYNNGSLLSSTNAFKVMDAGLSELSFSIDTHLKKDFEAVRGLKWDTVFNNIQNAVAIRNAEGFNTQIRVRCCVGDWNISQVQEIRSFWESFVDEIRFMPYIAFPPRERLQETPFVNTKSVLCNQLFNSLNIRADGIVDFCCNDWYVLHSLGTITFDTTQTDLLKMYNSKLANQIRLSQFTGRNLPSICAYCQQRNRSIKLQEEIV